MTAHPDPAPGGPTGVSPEVIRELAYAKLNLVLHIGRPLPGGMHPLCSLFASIDLADVVEVRPATQDAVVCPGVEGPNLALAAIVAMREHAPALPPLEVRIEKRIPVAAGLGGGSADAAAVLRAANAIAGSPLDPPALRQLAARLGSDVPSQVEPCHALVEGTGERVEPIELPPLAAVLVPRLDGLSTGTVYAELDRRGDGRSEVDPTSLRTLAAASAAELAAALENDLEPCALALRPELAATLTALRAAGALGAAVSGSGPTCFGLFERLDEAVRAAAGLPDALAVSFRNA
jgi:4-diphosphocytidyl-2-C-methyl-D-erythritol kinase